MLKIKTSKNFFRLGIVCMLLYFIQCKSDPAAPNGPGDTLPDSLKVRNGVFIYPAVIDMGKLERGVPVKSKVTLYNHSDADITLMDPTTTCGCTLISKSNKDKVASRDTAQYWVIFDAKVPGLFSKDFYINYVAQPDVLQGTVKGHVKF